MAPNHIFLHAIHTVFICVHIIPRILTTMLQLFLTAGVYFIMEVRFVINICCSKRFPDETETFGIFCVPLMNAPSAQMDCRVPAVATSSLF